MYIVTFGRVSNGQCSTSSEHIVKWLKNRRVVLKFNLNPLKVNLTVTAQSVYALMFSRSCNRQLVIKSCAVVMLDGVKCCDQHSIKKKFKLLVQLS